MKQHHLPPALSSVARGIVADARKDGRRRTRARPQNDSMHHANEPIPAGDRRRPWVVALLLFFVASAVTLVLLARFVWLQPSFGRMEAAVRHVPVAGAEQPLSTHRFGSPLGCYAPVTADCPELLMFYSIPS